MPNALYYGDNLAVLRESIPPESVDLIYLDPPFNSNASYNVLFKAPSGKQSQAQIEAFEDTWHWTANNGAELAFDQVMHSGNTEAANMLKAIRSFLGENDMMAYLAMMAVRLLELHRVLKPTGSLYLHCDPTASHYLKILLDAIFGKRSFRNEIIWKRNTSHNSGHRFGRIHDTLFYYTKSATDWTWNWTFGEFSDEQLGRYEEDEDGRLYKAENLTAERKTSSSGKFEWRGTMPGPTRGWAHTVEQLEEWWKAGLILLKKDGTPRLDGLKVYLDDLEGSKCQSIWTDIPRVANVSAERLGYDTQKPLALLERILKASSNEGDLILDPFCGCGTATHAAEKLHRNWIGIDITHLAIGLIERRLKDAFPGIQFEVHGTPKDFAGAEDLAKRDKYQFQWWAVALINAVPYGGKKKGADSGIDGYYYCKPDGKKTAAGIVSVKGGDTLHVDMVRDLRGVMEREKSPLGVLITLRSPTAPMVKEAASAGFLKTPFGQFQRLQVVTIGDLLDGKLPKLPPQEIGGGYRQAEREEAAKQHKLL
jgi:site-specific DNA-methyltransferase (adenine-specific)